MFGSVAAPTFGSMAPMLGQTGFALGGGVAPTCGAMATTLERTGFASGSGAAQTCGAMATAVERTVTGWTRGSVIRARARGVACSGRI